jgi:hypothetical protein
MSATGIVPDSTSKCRQGVSGLTVFWLVLAQYYCGICLQPLVLHSDYSTLYRRQSEWYISRIQPRAHCYTQHMRFTKPGMHRPSIQNIRRIQRWHIHIRQIRIHNQDIRFTTSDSF